jgi:hypothetical protein
MANDFGLINRKIRTLVQKFGRLHYPFIEVVLQRLLPQNSNKKVEINSGPNSLFLIIIKVFLWITNFKNVRPLFVLFFEKTAKNSAADLSGR